jgi:fatty acid desaturase
MVRTWSRPAVHTLSRAIIVALVGGLLLQYSWQPEGPLAWAADVLLRTYLMFLCTVMAHEGSHGHLGGTRRANDFWGRLALVGPMVPYMTFRKPHRMHHARTNIPGDDPDLFMKFTRWWEVPLRAVAMPHWWLIWLRRRGWLKGPELVEWGLNYVGLFAIYGLVVAWVGPLRFIAGALPSLVLVSIILWYPFAVKTHEGFSTGPAPTRSHNYQGPVLFWLTLGLALHRVHHLHPRLSWIEMLPHIEPAPRQGNLLRRLFSRSVVSA